MTGAPRPVQIRARRSDVLVSSQAISSVPQ